MISSCENFAFSETIEFDELNSAVKNKSILLIDVRNRSDFESRGRIPNSFNIPLHEISSGVFQLPNGHFLDRYGIGKPSYDKKIIISCYTGTLALIGAKYLRSEGYLQARAYLGSFQDWILNGGKVVEGIFEQLWNF